MKKILLLVLCLAIAGCIIQPALADQPDTGRMDQIGQLAAETAMKNLKISKGDPDTLVLTNAGRALVNGQTTEKCISGITTVSGLQNGDGTLYQVNRAEWKPLWFYFYNKKSGQGVYLEPADTAFTASAEELANLSDKEIFETLSVVTGDLDKMLADPKTGNLTQKELGSNAFSLISISNAWAHGAPYDLLSAVMLHNHFCPGVSSGYILARFVEEKMPIEDGSSYIVISSPTWCKDDIFPILWDMTPGKGGQYIWPQSDENVAKITEKYGSRPAGIYIRWNSKEKTGKALVLGFQFDSSTWTGPSWGEKPKRTVEMVENRDHPEKFVTVIKELTVDEKILEDLKNPVNNPYSVLGML